MWANRVVTPSPCGVGRTTLFINTFFTFGNTHKKYIIYTKYNIMLVGQHLHGRSGIWLRRRAPESRLQYCMRRRDRGHRLSMLRTTASGHLPEPDHRRGRGFRPRRAGVVRGGAAQHLHRSCGHGQNGKRHRDGSHAAVKCAGTPWCALLRGLRRRRARASKENASARFPRRRRGRPNDTLAATRQRTRR